MSERARRAVRHEAIHTKTRRVDGGWDGKSRPEPKSSLTSTRREVRTKVRVERTGDGRSDRDQTEETEELRRVARQDPFMYQSRREWVAPQGREG